MRANVSNLPRALEWYENVPGFCVTGTWPPENPNYAHFEAEDGATFSIMQQKHAPSTGRYNFTVKGVDGLGEALKHRMTVVEELFDTPYGSRKFTIADPDGNEPGFIQEA